MRRLTATRDRTYLQAGDIDVDDCRRIGFARANQPLDVVLA
jgi:hypothetical protein